MKIYRLLYKFLMVSFSSLFILSSSPADELWVYDTSLKADVLFWKAVFTDYHNNQYIIHDAENLKIIYKVVTFDSSLSDYKKEKHLEKVKDEIKEILLDLPRKEGGLEDLSHFEQYLIDLFGTPLKQDMLKRASRQIRAQQGMRNSFEEGLARSIPLIPFMKEIFRQQKLPEELAYLPHIESSFNPRARSKVGAAGMWQFMRSTGRLYMKVNRIVDERYDPFISTQAAARLLSYNYQKIGDWGLAITAYNFGLAGITRAVKVHGSDYMAVRESFNHRKFKFASRNFYPEFLAVLEIMQDYKVYFPEVQAVEPEGTVRYQLKQRVKFPKLAQLLGIRLNDFKELNPAYSSRAVKGRVTIPPGYWVNVPIESDLANLEMNLQILAVEENQEQEIQQSHQAYTLLKDPALNQTESSKEKPVSTPLIDYQKPGVVTDESSWNDYLPIWHENLSNMNIERSELTRQLHNDLLSKLAIMNGNITVFSNETLGHYADWLRVPLWQLQKLNGMGRRKTIYQGQTLKLVFSHTSAEDFIKKRFNYHLEILNSLLEEKELVNFVEYQIHPGESVWELARSRYQVPLELIQYFNMNSDMNRLYPGDILRIPVFQTNKSAEETL